MEDGEGIRHLIISPEKANEVIGQEGSICLLGCPAEAIHLVRMPNPAISTQDLL